MTAEIHNLRGPNGIRRHSIGRRGPAFSTPDAAADVIVRQTLADQLRELADEPAPNPTWLKLRLLDIARGVEKAERTVAYLVADAMEDAPPCPDFTPGGSAA